MSVAGESRHDNDKGRIGEYSDRREIIHRVIRDRLTMTADTEWPMLMAAMV